MQDRFNSALWGAIAKSPDLQKAIKEEMTSGGYSIPGVSMQEILALIEEGDFKTFLAGLIPKAEDLTISQFDKILGDLREVLNAKQEQGKTLSEEEWLIKDIDITTFATLSLFMWMCLVKPSLLKKPDAKIEP